jgi:cell division protein FtsQ
MNDHAVRFQVEPGAALRRSEAQSTRSILDGALRPLLAVCLSTALSAGAWQAWRWATSAPLFAIEQIRFTGLSHATEEALTRRSGLAVGQNLFRADLARASRALESHPWVASARLERRLPSTVVASIIEHRPAALVQLGNLYVLDDQGELFKRKAPEDGLDLPLVTGLARDDAQKPEMKVRLWTALQLLDAWRAEGLAVGELSELRLDDDNGATLFARDEGGVQQIRLGRTAFAQKLHRLAQVRAALARRGERAAKIDLDNQARPEWVSAQLTQQR